MTKPPPGAPFGATCDTLLHLEAKDFNDDGHYIGETPVCNFPGDIHLTCDLGDVVFAGGLGAHGRLTGEQGTNIKSGGDVRGDRGVELLGSLTCVTLSGESPVEIFGKCIVEADVCLCSELTVHGNLGVGWGCRCGSDIWIGGTAYIAQESLSTFGSFTCEGNCQVARNLLTGKGIFVTGTLEAGFNIFAGTVPDVVSDPEDLVIECQRLLGGAVQYGLLKEREPNVCVVS